jgi:exodeoxyribonuclease VII large subunit
MVEDRFGRVTLRGEISGWKIASSGHVYFRLKDDSACIDAVCWKGSVGKFTFKPEDGLEVVATGKLTTYPGKSPYQIVVDSMQPAGAGALMALLEKRRKALEEEGLFAASRKKKLPFMPQVVGVITSPTGAVIRDILHRISERYPVHVIVFPVAVQGEGAAEQIANAINFFNSLAADSHIPLPELLIVARGGGSIEDLWAFNEEIVVRAVAASRIPLISAVGHETDTTLIDHASDQRAPTPTAAAEIAIPVLAELMLAVGQLGLRNDTAILRLVTQKGEQLQGLARGLPKPVQLLENASQRLDDWGERLQGTLPALLARKEQQLVMLASHLKPQILQIEIDKKRERLMELQARLKVTAIQLLQAVTQKLNDWDERLQTAVPVLVDRKTQQLIMLTNHLKPQALKIEINNKQERLSELHSRLGIITERIIETRRERLENLASLLESVNYNKILARGFALVKSTEGKLVTTAAEAKNNESLNIIFADGVTMVTLKPEP